MAPLMYVEHQLMTLEANRICSVIKTGPTSQGHQLCVTFPSESESCKEFLVVILTLK